MAPTKRIAALVARRVREIRLAKRWTQVRLATEAGVARATIATIEAGHDVPSLDTMHAIASAFDLPPAALLLDPSRKPRDAAALAVLTSTEASARELGGRIPSKR